MTTEDIHDYFAIWGIPLSGEAGLPELMVLMKRICKSKGGYFLVKVDGERSGDEFTLCLNTPFPLDFVRRVDTDDMQDGVTHMLRELLEGGVFP